MTSSREPASDPFDIRLTTELEELLAGGRRRVACGPREAISEQAIFPGAFNPPHEGHFKMARIANRILESPVAYEISIRNVDKRPLGRAEIERRLALLAGQPVWLTAAATFAEKGALFPGATFVVGADTLLRIGDPAYYAGDSLLRDKAVSELADRGCDFLVFGRTIGGEFRTLADLALPPSLAVLCREVQADQFRFDLSSTGIRTAGRPSDP